MSNLQLNRVVVGHHNMRKYCICNVSLVSRLSLFIYLRQRQNFSALLASFTCSQSVSQSASQPVSHSPAELFDKFNRCQQRCPSVFA